MVDKAYYHQHPEEFAQVPKFTHDEHILQNALYGRLTSSRILCETCGSKFGQGVDSAFVSLFTPLTSRLKDVLLAKQHGKNAVHTVQGVLYEGGDPTRERRVEIRNRAVSPKHPYHLFDEANKVVTIYSNPVRAKQHQQVVIKELKAKGLNPDEVEFRFVEDVRDQGEIGIFFSEGVPNFNERWHRGFNKIALGFAMYAGVARTQVPRVLHLDDNGQGQLADTPNLIPYYPLGALDQMVELYRPQLEDYYPSHTLILFTQPRQNGGQVLFCYIELFSTFQYYVLLNDRYQGEPVYQSYHQTTTKSVLGHTNLQHVRYKFWNVVAEQYGVDTTKFPGGDPEAYQAFLQRGIDTYAFNPQLTLHVEVEKMLERLIPEMVKPLPGEGEEPEISALKLLEANAPGEYMALLTELHFYLTQDENSYQRFRTSYQEVGEKGSLEVLSYPSMCRDLLRDSPEQFKRHGHLKFNQLSSFINEVEQLAIIREKDAQRRRNRPTSHDLPTNPL